MEMYTAAKLMTTGTISDANQSCVYLSNEANLPNWMLIHTERMHQYNQK